MAKWGTNRRPRYDVHARRRISARVLVVAVLLSPATACERRTKAGCGVDGGTALLAEADELAGWDIVCSACTGGRGIVNQATAEPASAVINDAKTAVRTTGDFMLCLRADSLPLANR